MSATYHPTYPATRILSSSPLAPSEAHTFLQTFLHWTSSTRPIRNRKHPYNSLPVVPFPHSVLNNLRRIEMGLRGEQAPRIKSQKNTTGATGKKRKFADDTGEAAAVEEELGDGYVDKDAEVDGEKEVQMGGREMRHDGEAVEGAPRVLTEGEGGAGKAGEKKRKEERKKEKKARRREEKKVREEKRRKGEEE